MTEIKYRSDMKVELVQSLGSDETVARAARVSTGKDQLDQGKISGLIGYLVREGHCYDPETEILTRDRGWVKFPEVTTEDAVLARDVQGRMAWETPTEVINEYYDGPMVHLSGRNLDLVVTPNHRMFGEHRTQQGWQSPTIHRAFEFQDRAYKVYRGGGSKSGVSIPENIAKLLGFIIADGHVGQTNISFHLKKPRKVKWLETQCPTHVGYNANDTYHLSLKFSDELTRLARLTYNENRDRVIPAEVLSDWSSESIRHVLNGFLEGDGHTSVRGTRTATTVSPVLAEQLQVAAALSGSAAAVHGPFDYGQPSIESGFAKSYRPIYNVVFASDRHLKVRVGWTRVERERQVKWERYKGSIHCVTVPSGIVYVRRNGHTLWSGNSSTLEHCVVTLRMEVPIFVHRQLMTHRTLSKNSESGRYTELKPEFYVPAPERPLVNAGTSARPELQDAPGWMHRVVEAAHRAPVEDAWKQYTALIDLGVANEVARNVLPASTYTSLWMTGNLLAWFNFLRLRNGDKGHPQWEIVDVARQVEEIIADLYPITYEAWKESVLL